MADYQTELLVELIAKVDKFTEGLDQAISKMDQTQKKSDVANKGVSLNFLAMAAAVGFTVKALVDYGIECVTAAGKEAALAAALGQVAANLGLNKEMIDANIEAITQLGYDQSEAMTLIMRFARAELEASDATKIARVALDYAAASGRGYKETLDLLSNSIEMGNARALRQLGITANVGQVYEKYALTIGKLSATQLTDLERRQAVLNAVMENAGKVAGAYDATLSTAGGQMNRFKMESEKLKDALGSNLTPVVTVLLEKINDLIAGMNKMGVSQEDQLTKTARLKEWFRWMGVGWKEMGDGVVQFQSNLLKNTPWDYFMPRAREVGFINLNNAGATNAVGDAIGKTEEKTKVYVATLQELINKVKMLNVSQKDFTGDIGPVLQKIQEGYELQNLTLDQQIVKLRALDRQYKLTGDQRVQLAKYIADLENKNAHAEMDNMKKMGDQMKAMFASTIAGQIDLFGQGTKSMEEAFKGMINKMVQMLIESAILDFLSLILGGEATGSLKLLGFDSPENDMRAQMAGGKWFSDALGNFSKGYVNQALRMDQTGPVFAAAVQSSAPSGHTYNIYPTYSPMIGTGSPGEMRKAALFMANTIKRSIGGIK